MNRLQATDLGLAALAIVTLAAGALAASFANSPSADQTSASSSSSATTTESASSDPSPSASASASSTSSSSSASKVAVKTLPNSEAADLVVLGDASSNETGEWVNELGAQIGETRLVRVQRGNQQTFSAYNSPITYGTADPSLQVWNASVADPQPLDSTSVKNLVPKSTDLVLISQGRGAKADPIATNLDETLTALQDAYPNVPVGVIIQPDDGSSSQAITAVTDWASQNGLPVIDVAKAFSKSSANLQDSDGVLTTRGTVLWAQTVANAITQS